MKSLFLALFFYVIGGVFFGYLYLFKPIKGLIMTLIIIVMYFVFAPIAVLLHIMGMFDMYNIVSKRNTLYLIKQAQEQNA